MEIAVLLYPRFTALDAVGPYEVLSRLPGAQVKFVAADPGPQTTETQSLTFVADYALSEVEQPEILVVPGTAWGFAWRNRMAGTTARRPSKSATDSAPRPPSKAGRRTRGRALLSGRRGAALAGPRPRRAVPPKPPALRPRAVPSAAGD